MYTLPPSFVQLSLKMTKLCCLNQENSPFLSVRASCRNVSLVFGFKSKKIVPKNFYHTHQNESIAIKCQGTPGHYVPFMSAFNVILIQLDV